MTRIATTTASRGFAAGAVLLAAPAFMTVRMGLAGELGRFGLLFGATYLVGALAFTRRSPLAQVVGRAIAWKALVLQAWVLALRAMAGNVSPLGVSLVAAPALALVLARPLLHTTDARAAFAPRASRTLFLVAATASIAAAAYVAPLALHGWTCPAALTVLAVGLVAQAAAVLRMRAWGIALGAATATAVAIAWLVGVATPSFTAITALPGLAMVAAVGVAWMRKAPPTMRLASTRAASCPSSAVAANRQPQRREG